MGEDDYYDDWSGYDQQPSGGDQTAIDQGGPDYSAGNPNAAPDAGTLNEDGTITLGDGSIYAGEDFLGVDNGDGTWTDIYGATYDSATGDVLSLTPTDNQGGGFLDGVKNFFSGLFGGGGTGAGAMGGGAGGGFGGGGSAQQQQANQLANQLAQQLARAQQTGGSAAQIAQLQQQLAVARQLAAAAGNGDMSKMILIAAALGLGVYALTSSRRD